MGISGESKKKKLFENSGSFLHIYLLSESITYKKQKHIDGLI